VWIGLSSSPTGNQAGSIRLAKTLSHTIFPLAILEFPPESSRYSYFVPEEDLTYAGWHAHLRISQGLKERFRNPSRMILWPWCRHGIVCDRSIFSSRSRRKTPNIFLPAIEKVATKRFPKKIEYFWMGITIMSLKSYRVRRELGKDERRRWIFPCLSLYLLDFGREGRSEKNWILSMGNRSLCFQPWSISPGVRIDERRSLTFSGMPFNSEAARIPRAVFLCLNKNHQRHDLKHFPKFQRNPW
jgi:hypothetical protein